MKKAKLQEIIDFLELEEGYDNSEVVADILGEIKELKGYAADEIGLVWGDIQDDEAEELMILDDFVRTFYSKTIEAVCNVIKSFQKEG